MTFALNNLPTANGGWFKAAEQQDAVAILLEVSGFERQRPTPNGPKDSALADVTVFKTPDQLKTFTPEVSQGQRIEQTVLARDLEGVVGSAVLVTVTQVPAKKPGSHPAWVWRQVTDPEIKNRVIAYAEQRDTAVQSAVSDAPDFD
ncbi:hypothetical protein ACFVTF_26615 [Kitasatospora sp. NPDC057940]|uniref:hypothetical protein n=1 Tax=Kitasatospora sp. NPDC057940 TaxID=3346285 RepID=UPI0036DB5AA6